MADNLDQLQLIAAKLKTPAPPVFRLQICESRAGIGDFLQL